MLPGHYCAMSQAPGAQGGSAGLLQEGVREGPGEGAPIVSAAPLLSHFRALSWIVSRMSLDTFWRPAQPSNHPQKASGITVHSPVKTILAGSALLSISTCFFLLSFGSCNSGLCCCSRRYFSGRLLCSPHLRYFGLKNLLGIFGW